MRASIYEVSTEQFFKIQKRAAGGDRRSRRGNCHVDFVVILQQQSSANNGGRGSSSSQSPQSVDESEFQLKFNSTRNRHLTRRRKISVFRQQQPSTANINSASQKTRRRSRTTDVFSSREVSLIENTCHN